MAQLAVALVVLSVGGVLTPVWFAEQSGADARGRAERVSAVPAPSGPNVEVATNVSLTGSPSDDFGIADPLDEEVATPPELIDPVAAARPVDVALIGDSVSVEITSYVESNTVASGGTYRHAGIGGVAPCDLIEATRQLAAGEMGPRPDQAVLLFTGNVLTPCITSRVTDRASMLAAYEADTREMVDILVATDIAVVIVDVPQGRDNAPSGLGSMYEQLVDELRNHGQNVAFVDVDTLLTPGGRFHAELPCVAGEPDCEPGQMVPVRGLDGGHLCGGVVVDGQICHGAWRLSKMITETVQVVED
ncbi:MAG: hypothetical protein ACR2QE_21255 [Acidimicrobiales bacterium]